MWRAWPEFVRALLQGWGGVDLAVYLAGDYVPMTAQDFDLARAEQVVAVNFNGAMRLTRDRVARSEKRAAASPS